MVVLLTFGPTGKRWVMVVGHRAMQDGCMVKDPGKGPSNLPYSLLKIIGR
ncbi:hypothetical protein HNQ92_001044 [Rhabdobacter roseus]|uniref:Uncharacterized protein n=1 Tax=Rhabdobacter roseus TaxID=1655419 RepID=A0A840TSG9_9BACT|nr:hypothetical protein [Rhabdobacter roseus]MBB5282918.1 hypothetical protein [Rhabdobacter roseus]